MFEVFSRANYAHHRAMNLAIDIGNTHTRMGVFAGESLVCNQMWESGAIEQLADRYHPKRCGIACVGTCPETLERELRQSGAEVVRITGLTPTPLKMCYETPATLGADRLAAAVGAWTLESGRPLLVIDCGTCVTFDYVSAAGEYMGGNISPGVFLRLKAMHEHTTLLPLVEPFGGYTSIGKSTAEALQAGASMGVRREIEGYVESFLRENPEGHVFLTGGGLPEMDFAKGKDISIEKDLVLRGINAILNETDS